MTEAASFSPTQAPPADPTRTVFFGIPLKARVTARNWSNTVRDFNRTLASIYNQTNPNFRVLVGCHDVPEVNVPVDSRLAFLRVRGREPDLNDDPDAIYPDRARKLRRIGETFRELGGSWFMVLDADDLVSSRLVEFVIQNPNPNGFIVRQGYMLDQETRAVTPIPNSQLFRLPFDQICGSSAILRFQAEDFSTAANLAHSESRFARFAAHADHRAIWKMSIDAERPLTPLPFPAVTYVVNTGDNHSFLHGQNRKYRQTILIEKLRRVATSVSADQGQEFGISQSSWHGSPAVRRPHSTTGDAFRLSFIGCGAMKSGTTSLANYLSSHPEIGIPKKKELHFFDRNKFLDYADYHKNFKNMLGYKTYGEITPVYMYLPEAMQRIYTYNPQAKIFCILRNPIERAYSHYKMQVRRGKEKESFIDALKAETARHRGTAPHRERNYAYVDRGYYAEQIRHIWRLFPVRQTLFIKTDDLRITPEQTIQALFSFLGVAPLPVSQSILLNKGGYEDRPSPEEHAFLLDTFEFEIRAVERLLGWDCSSWLC